MYSTNTLPFTEHTVREERGKDVAGSVHPPRQTRSRSYVNIQTRGGRYLARVPRVSDRPYLELVQMHGYKYTYRQIDMTGTRVYPRPPARLLTPAGAFLALGVALRRHIHPIEISQSGHLNRRR